MEGFTYVDIFATKGIEYLLVISVLLLFVPFWRMVTQPAKKVYKEAENFFSIPELGLTMADGGDNIEKEKDGHVIDEVTISDEKH
jgi:glycine cleavage system H protein